MMNPKRIIKFLVLILAMVTLLGTVACQDKKIPDDVEYYTCAMHPQIKMDQPGQCPICGMTLTAKKKLGADQESHTDHVTSMDPTDQSDHSEHTGTPEAEKTNTKMDGIIIDPIRLQTIGVKTDEVKFRELSKDLQFQGKVAFDPKLWVAQKEYLIALRLGDRSLIRSSEQKLYFLGLSKDWIRLLRRSRKADLGFFLPSPGKSTFFEAFINQSEIDLVSIGTEVDIYDIRSRYLGKAVIRALGTMVDIDSRTVRALMQTDQPLDLKSNTFVQIKIKMDLGNRLSIPKSAILFNGDHNMVYVETAPGKFLGKKVELGVVGEHYYEVKEGLKAGEKVVENGHFLLDSETQLKMGTGGGHQH